MSVDIYFVILTPFVKKSKHTADPIYVDVNPSESVDALISYIYLWGQNNQRG